MKKSVLKVVAIVLAMALMLAMFASCGQQGEQGPAGQQGEQGVQGEKGDDGNGIASIIKTSSEGLVDTYTITFTDGTTTTFTVTNGADGEQGIQGIQGVKGEDGHTPVITIQNGYWYIDGVNTNQSAVGISGATGNGISNIAKTSTEGLVDTYTITYTNGTTTTFTVTNGTNGNDGKDGINGANGKDGVDGEDGKDGQDGQDGADGVSVVNAYVDENLHLWIVLSNGTKIDAGYVGVTVTPTPTTYTVTFVDYNGTELKVETVERGNSATAPANPTRNGYTFAGWDKTFDNVTCDLTVTATYTKNSSNPTFRVSTANAVAGADDVVITIAVENNPGIASMNLVVTYADELTLTDITYNSDIGGMSQQPQRKDSPVILNWFNGTADSEGDWIFVTLKFSVTDTATAGDYNISISYDPNNVYDITETNIDFTVVNGKITVS